MERSLKTTDYIFIKASTNSPWDKVDFAIIHLTDELASNLHQRVRATLTFRNDHSFHQLTYWDSPIGYFCDTYNGHAFTETILLPNEDWCFINLSKAEIETLESPENILEAHQLCITNQGNANFKAFSKYTQEEYWTESFPIPRFWRIADYLIH